MSAGAAAGEALAQAISARLARWEADSVAERLWDKDGSLWSASGTDAATTEQRIGWLDLPATMPARIPELQSLAAAARDDGFRRAAVLGMGGSSLAPELFSLVFGGFGSGGLELRVLDSTHPDAVREFRGWASEERTLFIVSSKSGTTTEPLAFHAAMAEAASPADFIAITDPGTPLEELANAAGFRAVVPAPSDVGGRYSALTTFGLVPAALVGVDLESLLDRARAMADACRAPATQNPALRLGALIGEAAAARRDKMTLLAPARLAPFGDWVEQLIAESTGKQGRGIVPLVGETPGTADSYASDRCFVAMTLAGEPDDGVAALANELEGSGHPVHRIELLDPLELGGEFVRWEVATAAAGIVLAVDPFDQPNVQESKDATTELLSRYRETGALDSAAPLVEDVALEAFGDADVLGADIGSVDGAVAALLASVTEGDYVAILAYLPPTPEVRERVSRLRTAIRDGRRVATTVGFGPRFLHSTGQLHKGGPATGVFLQLTAEPGEDLPIPAWRESFGTLIAAQALGDLQSLQRRGRRALRVHLHELDGGLERLESIVRVAVA